MVGPLAAYAGLLLTSALLSAGLAAYAWRHREAPGATPLAGMLVGMAAWAGFYGAGLLTHDLGLRILWLRFNWMGSGFVPAFWLLFALEYAGHDRYVNRYSLGALLSVPVATVLLAWTSQFHGLMWRSPRIDPQGVVTILRYEDGLWYTVFDVYTYLVIAVATVVIAGMIVRHRDMYTDQAVALIVGSFMPAVAYGVVLLGFVRPGIDPTPLTFPVTGLTFGYVIYRGNLLERLSTTGEVGRDAAVDTMQDGVVVVDQDDRVVDVNSAAREVLGLDGDPEGETVSALVPGLPALNGSERTVEVASPDGTRDLEVSVSPVKDVHGRVSGHSLVFRDVTERKQYRERLQVTNRVLRHNLRNDMTVVIGHADRIEAAGDGGVADSAASIREKAQGLSRTGEKLREAEATLEDAEPEPVDLGRSVRSAVESVRDDSGAEVAVDCEGDPTAVAVPGIATAVRELVENAVEHGDPEVRVGAEREDGAVAVTVEDDGPGVPGHEREVLEVEDETALKHGSGAGLWVAKWLVDRSGGSLSLGDGSQGSTVTVRLPAADGSATE